MKLRYHHEVHLYMYSTVLHYLMLLAHCKVPDMVCVITGSKVTVTKTVVSIGYEFNDTLSMSCTLIH